MKIITNNPYRIVGILANSAEKDILKQKSKIKRFSEVGKVISSEYDFSFFPFLQRSNNIIDKALSDIEQNQDKVTYSFFWFTNLSSVDNTAIQHLISGNKEKAFEIWEKLTEGKEVNTKNFSAFNNIGTLYLLEESKEKQKQGISAKVKLIESESFKSFINVVADETFAIDKNRQTEKFIDELLKQLKDKYSTADVIDLFSDCNGIIQKYISQKFTEEPVHKIETQIEQANNKRIKDKSNALQFGTDLHKNTKKELAQLKSILGATNLQYKMLADNVAKEILQCSIDYFNDSQEQGKINNYLEEAMKLVKLADGIAVNKITKDRIKDNINTLEEMKDRELFQAIELLKSVKDAYEANQLKIRTQVIIEERSLPWGQSINWDKVNEVIENSIDWNKVVELIKVVIPQQNVEKIINNKKTEKVREYRALVKFTESKLDSYKRESISYLNQLTELEKLEIELKTAEKKLTDIKNTTLLSSEIKSAESQMTNIKNTIFYSSEINNANYKMSKIRQFHLFRSWSERERQIAEQQKIISDLQKKSSSEKQKQIMEQEQKLYAIRQKSATEQQIQIANQQKIIDNIKIQIKNAIH